MKTFVSAVCFIYSFVESCECF